SMNRTLLCNVGYVAGIFGPPNSNIMSKTRISRLAIDQHIKEKLSKTSHKCVEDVLSLHPLDAMSTLGISHLQYAQLQKQLLQFCLPKCITAYDLLQSSVDYRLSFGHKQLDSLLHGGLQPGSITEFTGPAGVGKTQWCMYSAVRTVVDHFKTNSTSSVVYIDTETAFRPERVVEILSSKYSELESEIPQLLSKILLYQPTTVQSLVQILDKLELVVVEKDVKVLIVDSIASLARKEITPGSSHSNIHRSNLLSSWAARLKTLAQQLNLTVIVTNQVTSRQTPNEPQVTEEPLEGEDNATEGDKQGFLHQFVTPALGNTWTHCVNTRLILQYRDSNNRQLLIAKSPVAPFAGFTYSVNHMGITIQGDSFYSYTGTDPGLLKIKVQKGLTF
ncbi:unnamed protein product, partial [Meganyctiphanes norvegica]